jgi:hypothetical protein
MAQNMPYQGTLQSRLAPGGQDATEIFNNEIFNGTAALQKSRTHGRGAGDNRQGDSLYASRQRNEHDSI